MRLIIIFIVIIAPLYIYARDITEPEINYMPSSYIINIDSRQGVKFNVLTNSTRPKVLLNAISEISVTIYESKSDIPIKIDNLNSINELNQYIFYPETIGEYRIDIGTRMRSDYLYTESVKIKAVEIEGVEVLTPETIPIENDTFEIEIPVPDIIYKGLDVAFVLDNSASMSNEMQATKNAAKSIFKMLHASVASDVKASVVTFSNYKYNEYDKTFDIGNYSLEILPTENPEDFKYIPTITSGGDEFQFMSLYETAKNKQLWRDDSVKLLILMTDEPDNVYCYKNNGETICEYERKYKWRGYGNLSVNDINKYLSGNDYSVTVLCNEIDGDYFYGNVMGRIIKDNYAGVYTISDNPEAVNDIVNGIYKSMDKLIKKTVIYLNPLYDERNLVKSIEPISPIKCVDDKKRGFKYNCAKTGEGRVKYRIILDDTSVNIRRYNFLLSVKTDKGSLVAIKPISLVF